MNDNFLQGKNICLRALEPADVDLLYAWENNTAIWNVSNTLVPFSRFQIEEYVLNGQRDIFTVKQLRLMIDLQDPSEIKKTAGTIDLFDFDPLNLRAGVGILVAEPFQKKGYAFEAMKILVGYAFGTLRLHQLYCHISPENSSSIKLFEKLGFSRCGIQKDWYHDGRKWHDEWMFQLINHGE
ncbi:MAG: GNAT family N-acetyltransferase [bacterium]